MVHNNFEKDLIDGQKAEKLFAATLEKSGATNIEFSSNKEFDIFCKMPLKYEVKSDIMSKVTGNVAIEISCNYKPSGLYITEADFWVQHLPHLKEFCIINVEKLTAHILVNKYRVVMGGDNNMAQMVLIPIDEFKSLCGIVKELEEKNVN